jgi:hypothetical protein
MVAYEQMIEKVAGQIKTTVEALSAKADLLLAQEGAGWEAAGKNEEQRKVLALRVAARQISSEKAKLTRSGATLFEGMFVSVPREKDWAKMAYNKMKNTLSALDEAGRLALVEQGSVVLYENNHDGSFTRHTNPSLMAKQSFEEGMQSSDIDSLPPRHMALDANTSFSLVWDKNNMTFANGNANFKYGSNRPLEELDRTCLFMGRKEGTTGEPEIIEIRLSGEQAKIQFPTFVCGKIGLKPAAKVGLCYGSKATVFTADESVMDIFSAPPFALDDNGSPFGVVADWLGNNLKSSIEACGKAYAELDQKAKWDTVFGTIVEVVHIDPRENGGFIVTLGDTDIMSEAEVVSLYVPADQEGEVDFGVGSELLIVGSPWITREEELRFMVNSWWCANRIAPLADTDADGDGWD